MDMAELVFDATIRAIASSIIFIILYRKLRALEDKLEDEIYWAHNSILRFIDRVAIDLEDVCREGRK